MQALIEEYISSAQPVASKTLVDRYKLGVSSATVRNELSFLEDEGYLESPHTSSGRVPTDNGYRAFVDEILSSADLDEGSKEDFENIRKLATQADELIEQTSTVLARLTNCLSLVLTPSAQVSPVKQVTLVSLSGSHGVVIVVTKQGQVINRQFESASPIDPGQLALIQNTINELISRGTVDPSGLDGGRPELAVLDSELGRAVLDAYGKCVHEAAGARAEYVGLPALLQAPEFRHTASAVPLLQILEDETMLIHLFDDLPEESDASVRIGHEIGNDLLSGVSVVAAPFGPSGLGGFVAVIGPTRMNYSKTIQAVRNARETLDGE